MFKNLIQLSPKLSTDLLLKVILCLAISFAISPLIWEVSPTVDIMFGSLIICLVPAIFGWQVGGICAFIYVLAGAFGLPVFAGHQGGIHYFIPDLSHGYSESTGYLYGYIMASIVVGFLAEKISGEEIIKTFGLYLVGHIIIIGMGILHISQIPGSEFELIPFLKGLGPSFLIKGGLFMVIIQMIQRRIESRKKSE